jgi:rubrerythrin
MTTDFDAISEVLKKAFQVEVDGFTFYSMALEAATKPAPRRLFERLARDETEHKAYIMAVMRRYEDHGASSFHFDRRDPDLAEFSSEIFTGDFKEQAQGELSELGALSIATQLESNAVTFFDTAASEASDPQIGGFYRFLADWEGSHLRTLQKLHESIRIDPWPEKNG